MATLSRKQREIQSREQRILDVALEMLVKHSYHGLSMDRIAEELEYSKGTIYQHFSCKEDILIALANKAMQVRLGLFRRAAAFKARSRERMQGVGLASDLFMQLYPHYFIVEQILRLSSVWEKISPERRDFLRSCEQQCIGTLGGIVRDAIASGDLELPPHISPEDLVFGLWSINFGAFTIMSSSNSLGELGIKDGPGALRWHCLMLLDGYGWKPLTKDYDLDALNQRLATDLFAEEMREIKIRAGEKN